MKVRPYRQSDAASLKAIANASGFPYPDLTDPLVEAVVVIADEEDKPIMAVAAKRLVEIYLYVDSERSPGVKMDALKAAHRGMIEQLRALGYNSAEAFLPPAIAERFGKRLVRTFHWALNWPSFSKRF